jgi:uncharacterized membrane protein
MENNTRFTLGKINLILIAIGFLIIVLGFVLMSGSTTGTEFNPDIFSYRRITIGPMTSFFGFLFIVFAILYKPNDKKA